MTDYIDKQEAKAEFCLWCVYKMSAKCKACNHPLGDVPPADVRPVVYGQWERLHGDSRFMCSVCKGKENVPTIMGEPTVWDYCPNCGAHMRAQMKQKERTDKEHETKGGRFYEAVNYHRKPSKL